MRNGIGDAKKVRHDENQLNYFFMTGSENLALSFTIMSYIFHANQNMGKKAVSWSRVRVYKNPK